MTAPFRNILCPIDFSPNSLAAMDVARQWAQESDGTVTLLHVVPSSIKVGALMPVVLEPTVGRAEAEERLKELAKSRLNCTIPYETDVAVGDAASEILQGAVRHRSDSIVMATHGRIGLKHFFLGSVAERVVRESAVPVLTVRPKSD